MSIVEKAAEKLKNLRPDQAPPQNDDVPPSSTVPIVERAHERMHDAEPVDAAAPLWRVDVNRLKRAGLIPVEADAARRLNDEVRRVKRPLLNNLSCNGTSTFGHAERMVITSAVPGEGKTFTSLNLAMSLAREPDFEVLLVDADIPKSSITRAFGLEGKPGLMDLLVHKDMHPAEVIVHTDVPDLMVVPTGQRHPLTSELFGGRRMEQVLEAWGNQSRQRLLVFDSSPLLATSEAQILASHMGQVVMIVAAGRTHRQELKTAVQSFSDTQYVGFVLNMSRLQANESHYYDSYYSDYSSNPPE